MAMAWSITGSVRTLWKTASTAPASRPARIIALRIVASEGASSTSVAGEAGCVAGVMDQLVEHVELVGGLTQPGRKDLSLVKPNGEQAEQCKEAESDHGPEARPGRKEDLTHDVLPRL